MATAGEGSSCQGSKLPDQLFLAEWGRPESAWIYGVDKNSVDAEYITSRLFHDCDEEELLLYDSPYADPFKPLERCPIVNGRAEITNVDALKGKGLDHTCPLGVLTGSMLDPDANQDNR